MADYIPLNIQAEIMKRLPVISLIQFRSVSKQWKSVIDSPEFIADHCVIQHHTHESQHLLLSYMESGVSSMGYVARYFSILDDDTFPHHKVFMTTPVSVNRLKYHPTSLAGVSGGLFCIYGTNRNIMNAVIWNPSIKKTLTIVVPNVPNVPDDIDDHVPYNTLVGFGVCPRTSDPKLVKITFNLRYEKEYATIPNQVEVFSLSSRLWKSPSKLPRKSIGYMYPQVAINGFIYWLAYDMLSLDWKDQCYRLIMSFDLTSEEFTEVCLPQSLSTCKTHVYISKLKESLVVLEKNHASNANVWIMQNGDPKSFTHIFTINMPITSIRDVAGFRKNGGPIIVEKKALKENELIVYEPVSKQINYTGIAGAFYYFFASPYTQTLLLLDHKDSVDSETAIGIGKQEMDRGVYEEYTARRNDRLKRKRGESGVEIQTPSKQCLGVRMESAKRTVEVKKYEGARKMTTPLVERREVATAQRVERREPVTTQRYSLRSSSKVNKKPPLAMSCERSMDAATVERKTTVRRTARKGY